MLKDEAVWTWIEADLLAGGAGERQIRAMRLYLLGHSQQAIAEELGIRQPTVSYHLDQGRKVLLKRARARFGSALSWYRWIWHIMKGDVEEGDGWRPATVGPPDRREPLVDGQGNPVRLRGVMFRAEDMVGLDN